MRPLILLLLVLRVTLVAGTAAAGDGSAESPLTGEDVVRLHMQQTPADEIVDRIRRSFVEFDIADDMLDEFVVAGLPPAVIAAMVERQRELHAPDPHETAGADPEPLPGSVLRIRINPDRRKPPGELRLDVVLHPLVAEQFGLSTGEHRITDLALAVVCRTPDHVPDQWRSKSTLGRDFISTVRHKLLFFKPGATFEGQGALRRTLDKLGRVPGERDALPEHNTAILALPAEIEVTLEPDATHDLSLVVAVEIDGDRFYAMGTAALDGVVLNEQGASARAVIEAERRSVGGLKVKLEVTATATGAT
jgi:hypothetical protein